MSINKTKLKQHLSKLMTILVRGNGTVWVSGQALNQDMLRGMILGLEVVLGLDNSLTIEFAEGSAPLRKKRRKKPTKKKYNPPTEGKEPARSPPGVGEQATSKKKSKKTLREAAEAAPSVHPGPPPEVVVEDDEEWEANWDD